MSIASLNRQEFARLVQDRLIKAGEERPLAFDVGQFTLMPRGGDSQAGPVPLAPFHQMYLAAPHDLEFVLKQFVEFWKNSQSARGFVPALPAGAPFAHPPAKNPFARQTVGPPITAAPRPNQSGASIVWVIVGTVGLMMCGVFVLPFVLALAMLGVAVNLTGPGGGPGGLLDAPLPAPPPGVESTQLVGGPGGGQRWFYDRQGRLPVGVAYAIDDQWDDARPVLKGLQPVFDRQATAIQNWNGEPLISVVGKENYVVGGLLVDAGKYVCAVKVRFVRQDGERLDWTDSYESEWLGVPRGSEPVTLGSEGQTTVGIEARQGLVLDAVALLVRPLSDAEKSRPGEAQPLELKPE